LAYGIALFLFVIVRYTERLTVSRLVAGARGLPFVLVILSRHVALGANACAEIEGVSACIAIECHSLPSLCALGGADPVTLIAPVTGRVVSCSAALVVAVFLFMATTANDFNVSKQFSSESLVCQMVHVKGYFGFLTPITTVFPESF